MYLCCKSKIARKDKKKGLNCLTWTITLSWRDASCADTLPLFNGASDWKFFMNSRVSWERWENKSKHQAQPFITKQSLQTVHTANRFFVWLGLCDTKQCNLKHVHVQPQNLLRTANAGLHLSMEGRNKNKQEKKLPIRKKSWSYFYSLLKMFQFFCLQESTSEKSLCHCCDLVKLHLYLWTENLKKKIKTFLNKQELWIIYQITSIKWHKLPSKKKAVDKALTGLKVPTII